jgi:hypothetical protein
VEVTSPALPRTESSSRNAKIKVLLNGKPQGKVRLDVSLTQGQGMRFFVSDTDGNAVIKDLPEGMSCVTAITEDNLTDVLCLDVVSHSQEKISSFYMALSATIPVAHSLDDRLKSSERFARRVRLRKLVGTVADATGAVIPNTDVQVYRYGRYPKGLVFNIRTNEVGHFERSLEPGRYTVTIKKDGFGSEIVEIEISPDGSESEMRETLQVVAADTCGPA